MRWGRPLTGGSAPVKRRYSDGIALNAGKHTPKDNAVGRQHGVPVHQPEQTTRLEKGGLAQPALPLASRFDPEIQQRLAGQSHFRAQ
jgi:hypothetical protein